MTISLRNRPPDIESAIALRSEREGISLDEAAMQPSQQAVRIAPHASDFSEFAGVWTAAEAAEFEAALAQTRRIDPNDWKP